MHTLIPPPSLPRVSAAPGAPGGRFQILPVFSHLSHQQQRPLANPEELPFCSPSQQLYFAPSPSFTSPPASPGAPPLRSGLPREEGGPNITQHAPGFLPIPALGGTGWWSATALLLCRLLASPGALSTIGLSSRGGTGLRGPTSLQLYFAIYPSQLGAPSTSSFPHEEALAWGALAAAVSPPPTSASLGLLLRRAFLTRRHRRVGP